MTETNLKLTMKLFTSTSSSIDMPQLSESLRCDLLDLHDIVASAMFAEVSTEEGAKSGIGFDWNSIIITLIASGGVATTAITAIVTLTQAWLKRNEGRNLSIKFSNGSEITAANLSPEEQKRLTEALLRDLRGFTP